MCVCNLSHQTMPSHAATHRAWCFWRSSSSTDGSWCCCCSSGAAAPGRLNSMRSRWCCSPSIATAAVLRKSGAVARAATRAQHCGALRARARRCAHGSPRSPLPTADGKWTSPAQSRNSLRYLQSSGAALSAWHAQGATGKRIKTFAVTHFVIWRVRGWFWWLYRRGYSMCDGVKYDKRGASFMC